MTQALASFSRPQRVVAGVIVIVLTAALAYGTGQVALGALANTSTVSVLLGRTGQGLVEGSDVRMRGVLVGSVARIGLDDGLDAVAELELDDGVVVPDRSTFAITSKTLVGEKQVDITFDGDVAMGPHVADGDTITDRSRVVEFQEVLSELVSLFEAVDSDDLMTVVNDGLGAFVGQADAIGRAIDQGSRATSLGVRTLDDQVPAIRDLSLVAEEFGTSGPEFNRLAGELNAGLPTLTDSQEEFRLLLADLERFSRVVNATLVVDRPELDRLIVQGDNVTRMLFAYTPEVGELVQGLRSYTNKFNGAGGFQHPTVQGQAARFQIIVDQREFIGLLCSELPEPLAEGLPTCDADGGGGLPVTPDDLPGLPLDPDLLPPVEVPEADPGGLLPLDLEQPQDLLSPDLTERLGVDEALRSSLGGVTSSLGGLGSGSNAGEEDR